MTDILISDQTIDCDLNNFNINFNISSLYLSFKDVIIFDMLIISYQFFN